MSNKQTFLCDPSDVQWLLDTHLAPSNVDQPVPAFESFMLAGREDRPDRLDLFDEQEPRYYALPIAVYYLEPSTGRYTTGVAR
jgi:hypothetical protein